jgi:hypothetical protein
MYLPFYLKCPKCGAVGFAMTLESRSGLQPELDMAVTRDFVVRKAGSMSFAAYCVKCGVRVPGGRYIAKRLIRVIRDRHWSAF